MEKRTHYEVLGVNESCSQGEIRHAFLDKSKKHHPDKNVNGFNRHEHFVAINEAYSTLGKSISRSKYDTELAIERLCYVKNRPVYHYSNGILTNAPKEKFVYRDGSFYKNPDQSKNFKYKSSSYYGIKGVNRASNGTVAAGVVVFMIVGAAFHYLIVKASTSFTQKQLDERTDKAGRTYMEVKERARINGVKKQMELLLQIAKDRGS